MLQAGVSLSKNIHILFPLRLGWKARFGLAGFIYGKLDVYMAY